jgi:hypothetical protein
MDPRDAQRSDDLPVDSHVSWAGESRSDGASGFIRWSSEARKRFDARRTESDESVSTFLDGRLPPILCACGVEGELSRLVRASWDFIASEIRCSALPSERLWAKRVLYIHRKPTPDETRIDRRAYRIGVTDDPKRRNAVKRSEDSDYLPYFDLCAPLCDVAEASIQTLLLPFAKRAHATNRRASCFVLSDDLAEQLCLFLRDFFRLFHVPGTDNAMTCPNEELQSQLSECQVLDRQPSVNGSDLGGDSVDEEMDTKGTAFQEADPRSTYFRAGRCGERGCHKLVPLVRSRKACPLHAAIRKLQGRVCRLRERQKKTRSKYRQTLEKLAHLRPMQ